MSLASRMSSSIIFAVSMLLFWYFFMAFSRSSAKERDCMMFFLDFSFISAAVGWEKPGKEIFQMGLRAAGVRPDEALHIGDDLITDVQGARNCDIFPVLINRESTISHQENEQPCDIIHFLSEIMTYLE